MKFLFFKISLKNITGKKFINIKNVQCYFAFINLKILIIHVFIYGQQLSF